MPGFGDFGVDLAVWKFGGLEVCLQVHGLRLGVEGFGWKIAATWTCTPCHLSIVLNIS